MMLYRLLIETHDGESIYGDYSYFTEEPGRECGAAMNEFLDCYMPFDAEDPDNAEEYEAVKEKFRQLQDGTICYVDYGDLWDDRTFKVHKPWPVKPAVLQFDGKCNPTVRIEVYPWQEVDWPLEEIPTPDLCDIPEHHIAPDAHLEMAYEDRTCCEEAT